MTFTFSESSEGYDRINESTLKKCGNLVGGFTKENAIP